MITPRPKRWSITIGGTFPRRNPGMLTDLATSAYALSMLGFRSVKGTSTVIFTRLGLNCSTELGTLLTPVIRDEGRPKLSVRKPRQSYGDARADPKPTREPTRRLQ